MYSVCETVLSRRGQECLPPAWRRQGAGTGGSGVGVGWCPRDRSPPAHRRRFRQRFDLKFIPISQSLLLLRHQLCPLCVLFLPPRFHLSFDFLFSFTVAAHSCFLLLSSTHFFSSPFPIRAPTLPQAKPGGQSRTPGTRQPRYGSWR